MEGKAVEEIIEKYLKAAESLKSKPPYEDYLPGKYGSGRAGCPPEFCKQGSGRSACYY